MLAPPPPGGLAPGNPGSAPAAQNGKTKKIDISVNISNVAISRKPQFVAIVTITFSRIWQKENIRQYEINFNFHREF